MVLGINVSLKEQVLTDSPGDGVAFSCRNAPRAVTGDSDFRERSDKFSSQQSLERTGSRSLGQAWVGYKRLVKN